MAPWLVTGASFFCLSVEKDNLVSVHDFFCIFLLLNNDNL